MINESITTRTRSVKSRPTNNNYLGRRKIIKFFPDTLEKNTSRAVTKLVQQTIFYDCPVGLETILNLEPFKTFIVVTLGVGRTSPRVFKRNVYAWNYTQTNSDMTERVFRWLRMHPYRIVSSYQCRVNVEPSLWRIRPWVTHAREFSVQSIASRRAKNTGDLRVLYSSWYLVKSKK